MISDLCEKCKRTNCKWKGAVDVRECNWFDENEEKMFHLRQTQR